MLNEFHANSTRIYPNNFAANCYVFLDFGERKIHYNLLTNMKVSIGLDKNTVITYILNEIYKNIISGGVTLCLWIKSWLNLAISTTLFRFSGCFY